MPARRVGARLVQYVGVLAVAVAVVFTLPRAMPGGPLRAIGGENVGELDPAERAAIIAEYGLDQSLLQQFGAFVAGLFRGDLGTSFSDGRPVTEVLLEALPWTVLLVGTAVVLSTVIGILLGVVAGGLRARRRGTPLLVGVLTADAMPAFWVGMLLILTFGVWLPVLPTFGATSPGAELAVGDVAAHLVLPVVALVLTGLAQTFLVTRASTVSVLGSGHVEHARARGLSRRRVLGRHVLRNAALPVHTVVMLEIGWLVGGALVVETLFAYPGLGRLTFDAVTARDFPLMQGAFLLLSLTVVLMNLIADLTYPLLDPRLRERT